MENLVNNEKFHLRAIYLLGRTEGYLVYADDILGISKRQLRYLRFFKLFMNFEIIKEEV